MNNGTKLSDEELYRIAERRIRTKREFLTHLVMYVIVNIFLLFMNLFTSPGYLWVLWVTFGWGIGIAAHGIDTYVKLNLDRSAVDREVERLRSKGM